MPYRITSNEFRTIRASLNRDIASQREKGNVDSALELERIRGKVSDAIASLDATPDPPRAT